MTHYTKTDPPTGGEPNLFLMALIAFAAIYGGVQVLAGIAEASGW